MNVRVRCKQYYLPWLIFAGNIGGCGGGDVREGECGGWDVREGGGGQLNW